MHDPATGRIPPDIHARESAFAALQPRRSPGEPVGGLAAAGDKISGWSYRGPWNVGGRTRALAIDAADPTHRTLLAGGVSGGMWRTTNDGGSWTLTTGSSQLHSVTAVAQDIRMGHRNVWYYGTGEARGASTSQGGGDYLGDGVFKSMDGGVTWNLLPSTSTGLPQEFDNPFNYVWRLLIDPNNLVEDVVYAATWGVIYRSNDGGATWSPVLGDANDLNRYTDLTMASDGVLYATLSSEGGQPGIYRSVDGLVWTDISTAALLPDFGRITMDIAPSNENLVYFLVSNPTSSALIQFWRYSYLSGDGSGAGGSWEERTDTIQHLPYPYGNYGNIYSYSPQRGYNMLVDVDPVDFNTVFIGGVHLWRSIDGFASETYSSRVGGYYYDGRSHHADVHLLVRLQGSYDIAYTASDGGVHKTTDLSSGNVTWTSLNNGYNTSQFYTVALDPDLPGNDVVLGGTQDNGTLWTGSAIGTADWVEIFGGDGAACAVLDADAGVYVVSYYFANIYRVQIDGAGNGIQATRLNGNFTDQAMFINPFLVDPMQESTLYVATSSGVRRHPDIWAIPWGRDDPVGIGWEQLTNVPAGVFISALGANAQPNHALYYGSSLGEVYKLDDVMAATWGATPANLTSNGAFPAGAYLSDIAVHPDDDDKVLLCFGNYEVPSLWYTDDGGATWADVESNLGGPDGPSVRAVAIVPGQGADLWLTGTSTGIYSTVTAGPGPVTWVQEAPEIIGNVVVDDFMVRYSDRRVVVGTHGRGIFDVTVPTVSGVPETKPFMLGQNVPNPFNPRTEIAFDLPHPDHVRLVIYDLKGRQVRSLVDGPMGAGGHVAVWNGLADDGSPAATGIYLYMLESGGVVERRKMTLLR